MNNYERIKSLDIGGMICFIRNLTDDKYEHVLTFIEKMRRMNDV